MDRQGELFGIIPYDFRTHTWARVKERMWNPEEERIVVPRVFGVGWTLNLYRLREDYPIAFYALVAGTTSLVAWNPGGLKHKR
ncbi:MAG: DUF5808 domain-containing protein [Actinomycetia bacterium]|nr:hypothetical protein [Actinomycetota bacterium]MCG2795603.1 DUF5808 domain-containing protein [Actinomycetes bacterium]